MSTLDINQIIYDYEEKILHFVQRDIKYIKEIFQSSSINIERFKNPEIKKIIQIIVNYYEQHGSLLVRREFETILDQLVEDKTITVEKHGEYIQVYDSADVLRLDANQFNRIFKEWLSVSCIPDINDIVKKNHSKFLTKGLGTEFIENTGRELEKLYLKQEDRSLVQAFDLDGYLENHIEDVKRRREFDLTGIKTGISKLDEVFMGFEPGSLTLIGAITGGGKSTLAMNFTRNMFERSNKPINILVISLEMGVDQWIRKYNVMDAFFNNIYLPYTAVLRGDKDAIPDELLDEYFEFLKKRTKEHKERGLNYKVIQARANKYTWSEILTEWKSKLPNFKPDIVFIDYIALLKLGDNAEKRNIALGNL